MMFHPLRDKAMRNDVMQAIVPLALAVPGRERDGCVR
jgi:hypothetical protein